MRVIMFALTTLLLADASWAVASIRVAICIQGKEQSVQRIREDLELELELSKGVSLKKCSSELKKSSWAQKNADIVIRLQGGHLQALSPGDRLLFDRAVGSGLNLEGFSSQFVAALKKRVSAVAHLTAQPQASAPVTIEAIAPAAQTESVSLSVQETPAPDSALQLVETSASALVKAPKGFLGASMGGEGWHYLFTAQDENLAMQPIKTRVYPKGGFNVEYWPLSWLGFDLEAAGAFSAFRMRALNVPDAQIQTIWARYLQGALGTKARLSFHNGLGLGLRSAYRFWGAMTDPQSLGGSTLTQVPSFQMHAFEIGGEGHFRSPANGVEVRLGVFALPLVYYKEEPDALGTSSMPLGMGAQFLLRYAFVENWHIALEAKGLGLYTDYQGAGTRMTVHRDKVQGGVLLSYVFSGTLGIGWSF